MFYPLISIIVPIYNVENHLVKCINSIINQTYKNIEIILVDDGSIDCCPKICDDFAQIDKRIVVIHKPNGGASSARNAGLDICKGEYIGFVDSDDFIESDMFEELFERLKDQPKSIAITGVVQERNNKKISVNNLEPYIENKNEYIESLLMSNGDAAVWSKLFPKDIIGTERFDERIANEDLMFIFSIEKNFEHCLYTQKIGYHYMYNRSSISRAFGKSIHDMISNAKVVREYINVNFPALEKQAERFEIFQNMAFLWNVPIKYDDKTDPIYKQAFSFVKSNIFRGLKNPYMAPDDKVRLMMVTLMPKASRYINYCIKRFRDLVYVLNKR